MVCNKQHKSKKRTQRGGGGSDYINSLYTGHHVGNNVHTAKLLSNIATGPMFKPYSYNNVPCGGIVHTGSHLAAMKGGAKRNPKSKAKSAVAKKRKPTPKKIKVYMGARGGLYTITASGNKRYIKQC